MSKNIWWEKRQYLIFELFDWILNFNWFPIVIKKSFIIYVCFIKIDWWKICMSTFMYFLSDIKIWKFISWFSTAFFVSFIWDMIIDFHDDEIYSRKYFNSSRSSNMFFEMIFNSDNVFFQCWSLIFENESNSR